MEAMMYMDDLSVLDYDGDVVRSVRSRTEAAEILKAAPAHGGQLTFFTGPTWSHDLRNLDLLILGSLVCVHYFPGADDKDAGMFWQSLDVGASGDMVYLHDGRESYELPRTAFVDLEVALDVISEFASGPGLPSAIEWFEL